MVNDSAGLKRRMLTTIPCYFPTIQQTWPQCQGTVATAKNLGVCTTPPERDADVDDIQVLSTPHQEE